MRLASSLAVVAVLYIGASFTPAWARRELATIPVGATAFVVCHGNLAAREDQEYLSAQPFPIIVDDGMAPAALETFNGTSDTPEPRISGLFRLHLEATLGGAANAACHLSANAAAAQSMLVFWQGQYGPPGNAPPKLLAWAPPTPDAPKARNRSRRETALDAR